MKTVYVLGAGFSRYAGFPLQSELLARFPALDLIDAPADTIDVFAKTMVAVQQLLSNYPVPSPSLEDLFTLLDQSIARRESCFEMSWKDLDSTRDCLKRALLFAIHSAANEIATNRAESYKRFAAWLCLQRVNAGLKQDPFSIISLNWDTLLEDSIYSFINVTDFGKRIDVDYCCYTSRLTRKSPHTPSLLQKAKRIFNIKILKLHGSANWLVCAACARIFTGIGAPDASWRDYVEVRKCPVCKSFRLGSITGGSNLEPYLITPTFLKAFDTTHIQSIWHNAFVELREAEKIVFVGYSLPLADFHVRTLFRRALRPATRIQVVLSKHDRVHPSIPTRMCSFLAASRYREFFGERRVRFGFGGFERYAASVVGNGDVRKYAKAVGRMI